MATILVIMDPRGIGYDNILNDMLNTKDQQPTVKILAVRGVNLQWIETKAIEEFHKIGTDQTYIM